MFAFWLTCNLLILIGYKVVKSMPRDQVHGGDTLYLSALNYIMLKTEKIYMECKFSGPACPTWEDGGLSTVPPNLP